MSHKQKSKSSIRTSHALLLSLQKRIQVLPLLDMVLVPLPRHLRQIGGLGQTNVLSQEILSTLPTMLGAHQADLFLSTYSLSISTKSNDF